MSGSEESTSVVIAGAGYAGLHIALRLTGWLARHPWVQVTMIDRNDYHQVLTELPKVAAGVRSQEAVQVPYSSVLSSRINFHRTELTGFDLRGRRVLTAGGPVGCDWLVLALGSRPNDFAIPGLAERALYLWSVDDAQRVWVAVNAAVDAAAQTDNEQERRRLLTLVIGGGGATGVELAGAFAEELPELARRHGLPPDLHSVIIVEAGPTILAGSSPRLIARAGKLLAQLGVQVHTNSMIAEGIPAGFRLRNGEVVAGGVFVWAGGVKAPALITGSGLIVGHNGRIKVDQYLRALDHSHIFAAGDLASVPDPETGRALPPLAQIALEEGDTVAHNLSAAIDDRPLQPFHFANKGFVVSVGGQRGVAEVGGRTLGGRLAHILKESIEWEYRQSVKHLRGWSVV